MSGRIHKSHSGGLLGGGQGDDGGCREEQGREQLEHAGDDAGLNLRAGAGYIRSPSACFYSRFASLWERKPDGAMLLIEDGLRARESAWTAGNV